MVMMHELAHCQQMNHGRDFWKVNNQFKGELSELWAKNYTGDGLWGRGQTLLSGQYDTNRNMENERMPANLCGGTFRSRRRKRRRRGNASGENGREETYAEAKQRRIAKKFGVCGNTLGGDEATRVKLEYGQKVKGNPRVANSSRGRELRVAAAAARLGQQKTEEAKEEQAKRDIDQDDEHASEDDEFEDADEDETATNLDGTQILDEKGRGMVRVCSDEDADDAHVKEEMNELQELDVVAPARSTYDGSPIGGVPMSNKRTGDGVKITPKITKEAQITTLPALVIDPTPDPDSPIRATKAQTPQVEQTQRSELMCPMCSMCNEPSSFLCIACSHVLDTRIVSNHWRCQSDICRDGQYINSADCGMCGVCRARRPDALAGD